MITHRTIGNQGRLGNQLFQYASTLGIALNNNYDYCFNLEHTKLLDYFNITERRCPSPSSIFNYDFGEGSFCFNAQLFNNPDNASYHGYLQSYKYFQHCEKFIKKEFEFKNHILEKVRSKIDCNKYVSVHVRRTDYLNLSRYHTNLNKEWYQSAMSLFPDRQFLFFSDDISWCQQNFSEHSFSPFFDEAEDLCAMTLCCGSIIANSSFSWWGAYLNKLSDKVVCPKSWFGIDGPKDTQDIYINNWIII